MLVQQLPSDSLQRERDTWGCTKASSVPIITSEAGECGAILSSAKAVSITINYQVLINKSWFVRLINSINNSDTRLMQLGSMKNAVLVIQLSVQCHCHWWRGVYDTWLSLFVQWSGVGRVNRCRVMQVCTVHALSYPCYQRTALSQQLFVHISCSTVNTTRFCCFRLLRITLRYQLTRPLVQSFFCHLILSTVSDLSMCNCNYVIIL